MGEVKISPDPIALILTHSGKLIFMEIGAMSTRRVIVAISRESSHSIWTGTCRSMPRVDVRRLLCVQRKTVGKLIAITKLSAVLTPVPVSRDLRQILRRFSAPIVCANAHRHYGC